MYVDLSIVWLLAGCISANLGWVLALVIGALITRRKRRPPAHGNEDN